VRAPLQQGSGASFSPDMGARTPQVDLRPVRQGGVAIEDATARRAAEHEAAATARLDALTGLPNRLLLLERLGQSLARYSPAPSPKSWRARA
jgi:hypothetical protein